MRPRRKQIVVDRTLGFSRGLAVRLLAERRRAKQTQAVAFKLSRTAT